MKELLLRLSGLTGPSGWEDQVRQEVRRLAEPYGDAIYQDALGNLIVRKRGAHALRTPVVLAAYLDEPGFMVKAVTEEGLVRFGLMSGTDIRTILGKQVQVGEAGLRGVIGLKPIHLTDQEERKTLPKAEELYIDLGAQESQWTRDRVEKGDCGVFAEPTRLLGDFRVLAKALGRSIGCAVLLKLMTMALPVDVTFVFTTQRQVGSRGAYGAGAGLRPGYALVLELCPGADSGHELPRLGHGPVIPAMDQGAMFDPVLINCLRAGALEEHAMVQPWASVPVQSDGAQLQRACSGARTAALYCPAKYLEAPCQMADLRDVEQMPRVLHGFLKELEAKAL